jgi:hypothetical protein
MGGQTVQFSQFGSTTALDASFAQSVVAVPRGSFGTVGNCGMPDCDGDGLDDELEETLAYQFFPTTHYHRPECGLMTDRLFEPEGTRQPVLYRARYVTLNGVIDTSHMVINYVMLYTRDCGAPGGAIFPPLPQGWDTFSHEGDNEPFAVFLFKDAAGQWQFETITAIAHNNTGFEHQSVWGALNEEGRPDLWVGYKKHGNYTILSGCTPSWLNECTDPGQGLALRLYNVGERLAPFIDDLSVVASRWRGKHVWGCDNFFPKAGVIRGDLYLAEYQYKGGWDGDADIVPGTSTVILGEGSCPQP